MAESKSTSARRRFISLGEAAAYLDINERTLRRLIANGQLTGYRLGSRLVRVDLDQLDALLRPIPKTG